MKTYMKPETRSIKMVASAQLMAGSEGGQIDNPHAKPGNKPVMIWSNDEDSSSDETEYSLDSPLWK